MAVCSELAVNLPPGRAVAYHGCSNFSLCVVGFVHGSSSSEGSRRGSGVNKQMDLVFYLFLTGVRVVPEPSDTSTTINSCTKGDVNLTLDHAH